MSTILNNNSIPVDADAEMRERRNNLFFFKIQFNKLRYENDEI